MPNHLITSGPKPARIMFVGEAPGYREVEEGKPLVGPSGWEFSKMCQEAGISRETCFITNLLHEMPQGKGMEALFYKKTEAKLRQIEQFQGRYPAPIIREGLDTLHALIREVRPNLIVALGDAAMWALTGNSGIMKWRGSILDAEVPGLDYKPKVIPTYNPAAILRNWPWRWMFVQDLRRASRECASHEINYPAWNFRLRPSLSEAISYLEECKGHEIVCDIETRGGQISCIGFAKSKLDAICIPLMILEEPYSYWSALDETAIVLKIKELFLDAGTTIIFHNGIYDTQYIAKLWGFLPAHMEDTMVAQHTAFAGLQKSLAFCASIYCEYYKFWKDEGKEWNVRQHGEEAHWHYNCLDTVYSYECWEVLSKTLKAYRQGEQYRLLMDLHKPLLRMMFRGIRVDTDYKARVNVQLLKEIQAHSIWFEQVLGHPLNERSADQMKRLFYSDFGIKPIINKKTRSPTLDDEALKTIKTRKPELAPLVDKILENRSLGVFRSTFALAPIDGDSRARCNFNPARVETYRLSSSKNVFGTGLNLQTIPKGREDD